MKRLESRKKDRDLPISRNAAIAQLAAIREWGTIPATGRYANLKNITHPTLIVHGNKRRCRCADQRSHPGGAHAERSIDRVLRFESRGPVPACRDVPGAPEALLERPVFSGISPDVSPELYQVCGRVIGMKQSGSSDGDTRYLHSRKGPGTIALTIMKEMPCRKQRKKRTRRAYLKASMFCSINVTTRRPSDTGLPTTFSTVLTYLPEEKGSSIL